jgi:hypothetical protein
MVRRLIAAAAALLFAVPAFADDARTQRLEKRVDKAPGFAPERTKCSTAPSHT